MERRERERRKRERKERERSFNAKNYSIRKKREKKKFIRFLSKKKRFLFQSNLLKKSFYLISYLISQSVCLLNSGKAGSLQLQMYRKDLPSAGSTFDSKYQARIKVSYFEKHSSLLPESVNYTNKGFVRTGSSTVCRKQLRPGDNVIKLFCPQFKNFCNKLECLFLASFSSLI